MGSNPYVLALLGSFCFGVAVFPWQSTARALGPAGLFLGSGIVYLVAGSLFWIFQGFPMSLTSRFAGLALLIGIINVGALTFCTYSFAHPAVKLPIATAITAAYPIFTIAIALVLMGQRFTKQEAVFFVMAVISVVGLALSRQS